MLNLKHLRKPTSTEQDADAAIRLIERAALMPYKFTFGLRACAYIDDQQRFNRAMELLPHLMEFMDDTEAPDVYWWRDYYTLSGEHVILTDEGWEPGECKAAYLADDPEWTPNDELNAPDEAASELAKGKA